MVSSIAYDVGFGDLSYFNRTFRRRFDVTPSQVRAQAVVRAEVGLTPHPEKPGRSGRLPG